MSKFTTETRYICETYSGVTNGSINECIEKSIPYIFSDDWTTYNPDHKQELCKKILRHYYMSEIGFETVGLWKLQMNEYLSEIMPKYNVIYAALEETNNRIMNNVDTTEIRELTGKQSTRADSNNTDKTDSVTDSSNSSTSHSSGTTSGNSDGWQESNDTPQGGLDGIESRRYLSNAVHNRATTGSNNSQDADASGTGKSTSSQNATSTGHSSGSSDTSENYTLKITGKNSGTSYLDELLKVQSQYNDVDMMIINDLNICFMGLWE